MDRAAHSQTSNRLVAFFIVLSLLSSIFVSLGAAPVSADTQTEFSTGEASVDYQTQTPGSNEAVVNITLPVEAKVDSATMTITSLYDNGNYLRNPVLSVTPKDREKEFWAFEGDGYGEFGRQSVFVDDTVSQEFTFPDDGGEEFSYIRLPKNATVTKAQANITGAPVGFGEVEPLASVSSGTAYPYSQVETVALAHDSGKLYTAWADNGDLDYADINDMDIFFKYSDDDGDSWSETVLLSQGSTAYCYYPEIAVEGSNVYVIWQSTDSRVHLAVSHDGGQSWDLRGPFDDPTTGYSIDVSSVAAANGYVYISWVYSSDIYVVVSDDGGDSWGSERMISDDRNGDTFSDPSLAASGDGVYVGYVGSVPNATSGTDYSLACGYSTDHGETWDQSTALFAVNDSMDNPQARAKEGTVYMAVISNYGNYDDNLSFVKSEDNGASWYPATLISTNPLERVYNPDISVFKGMGTPDVYATWETYSQLINYNYNISYAKSTDGGSSWKEHKVLSDFDSNYYPAIASDMFSRVYVAWDNYTSIPRSTYDLQLRVSGDDGGSGLWQDIELLSDETFDGNSDYPAIAAWESDLYFVWEEEGDLGGNGFDRDVFFRYYDEKGDTWYDQKVVSDHAQDSDYSNYPEVAADKDGNVYVVWVDNGDLDGDNISDTNIHFRSATNHGNGAWSPVSLVSRQSNNNTNSSSYPVVAARASDGKDYVGVVWLERDADTGNGTDQDVFFRLSEDGGANWQDIELVSVGSMNTSYYPAMTMDDDYVYVGWHDYFNSTYSLLVARRPLDGGAWERVLEMTGNSSNYYYYCDIANSEDGYLYLSWVGVSGSSYNYFSSSGDQGQSWTEGVQGEIVSAGIRYNRLAAYEDAVALVNYYGSNIYVNASLERGAQGSWLGRTQVDIDFTSETVRYPFVAVSTEKNELYCGWMDNGNLSGSSYDEDIILTVVSLQDVFPTDASVDVGDDGDSQWSHAGQFNGTESFDFMDELKAAIASADVNGTDKYNNAYVDIPVMLKSESRGRLRLDSMLIEYSVRVDLLSFDSELDSYLRNNREDAVDGFLTIPIDLYTSAPGSLRFSELQVEYHFEPLLWLFTDPDIVTGDEIEISWEAQHFAGEELVLEYDDGSGWENIATVDPDDGSYSWDVSGMEGEFMVRALRESGDPQNRTGWFYIDHLPPQTSNNPIITGQVGDWGTEAEIYLSSVDQGDGSGVFRTYYTVNGSDPDDTSSVSRDADAIRFSTSGNHTLKYAAVDMAGLWEEPQTLVVRVDEELPQLHAPTTPISVYTEGEGDVMLTIHDNLSGFDLSKAENEPVLQYAIGDGGRAMEWKNFSEISYSRDVGYTVHITASTQEENWNELGGESLHLRATVRDLVGNSVEEMEFHDLIIKDDTLEPVITDVVYTWTPDTQTPGSLLDISVLSDEDGLEGNATIVKGDFVLVLALEPGAGPGEYVCQWDTTGVLVGTYDLTVALWDGMLNTETMAKKITVKDVPSADVQVLAILLDGRNNMDEVGIGANILVEVTVRNEGNADGSNVVVIFKDDGEEFQRETITHIEPDRNAQVTGNWVVSGSSGDKHIITVHIGEDDTSSLAYDQEIELQEYADLVVSSLKIFDGSKETTTLKQGKKYTLTVEIANTGDVDAQGTPLNFEYRLSGGTQVAPIKAKIITMAAGASETIEISWTAAGSGAVVVAVVADPDETIDEISRANNEVTVDVTVEASSGPTTTTEEEGGSIMVPLILGVVVIAAGISGAFFFLSKSEDKEKDGGGFTSLKEKPMKPKAPVSEEDDAEEQDEEEDGDEGEEEPEKAPAPVPQKTKLKCPTCSTILSVASTQRPIKITCPKCKSAIVLKEEGSKGEDAGEAADEEEEPEEPKAPVKLKCSGCEAVMVIKQQQRPIVVKCPKCQTKTTLE